MKMKNTLSAFDLKFLRSVGISAEPAHEDTRLELAQRIAKHQSPAQVPDAPDAALLALVRLALARLLAASEEREQ